MNKINIGFWAKLGAIYKNNFNIIYVVKNVLAEVFIAFINKVKASQSCTFMDTFSI